ncbi:MAG: type IV pilin-like G/H family protein [Thermosynechococcaceae cyanobacterium]
MVTELRWLSTLLLLAVLTGCGFTPSSSEPEQPSELSELSGDGQVRQQEGNVSISAIGRAQQAYFLENSKYAKSLEDLDIALTPQYYDLAVVEVTDKQVIMKATPREAGMKSYIGGVSGISQRIVCASDNPGTEIANPVFQSQAWSCAPGSTQVE